MVDIYSTPSVPTSWYEHYLDELSISTIPFSERFEHTSHSQLVDMNDGERVSLVSLSPWNGTFCWDTKLHLQAMRLGSAIFLTRPLLLQTTSAYLGHSLEYTSLEFGLEEFSQIGWVLTLGNNKPPAELAVTLEKAHKIGIWLVDSVKAASDLAHLCLTLVRLGSFPEKCWLPM